jgi:hypothetical protein
MCRAICGCLALFVITSLEVGAAELRWQFRKEQTFKYAMKHREVRLVELADQKFETTTTVEFEWQWTVQDVDADSVATLGQRFTSLVVHSTGKDFDFRYDSAQANQSQDDYTKKLIHLYEQVRFGEYRVRLRPDGRVASVSGFDKLLGEISADSNVLDFHALNLRDDTFGWYLQQALGVLPAKGAAVEKWESRVDSKLAPFGQATGKTEYMRGKPQDEAGRILETITFKGSQLVELDMKWLNNALRGPLKVTKLTGAVRFDPKAGRVHNSTAEAEISGELLLGNDNPSKMKLSFQHTLELMAKP